MAQVDVYCNPARRAADRAPFLLGVPRDLIDPASRVIGMPARPACFSKTMRILNPLLPVADERVVLSATEIGSCAGKRVGPALADQGDRRGAITAALDASLRGSE